MCTIRTASSTLEYRTVQNCLSIKSFTELLGRYERFNTKRNSPGTLLGINARGEQRRVGNGGDENGSEIRP
jgi:hypothetical protein